GNCLTFSAGGRAPGSLGGTAVDMIDSETRKWPRSPARSPSLMISRFEVGGMGRTAVLQLVGLRSRLVPVQVAEPFVGGLDLLVLERQQLLYVRRQHLARHLLILLDGCFLAARALLDHRAVGGVQEGRFDVDPSPVQGPRHRAAALGGAAMPAHLFLELPR